MDTLATIADRWLLTLEWLAGLSAAFGLLARLCPCNPGMYWWKDWRAAGTDLLYWFVVPLVMLVLRALLLVAVAWAVLGGGSQPVSVVAAWPFWVPIVTGLLIQDVLLYLLDPAVHPPP